MKSKDTAVKCLARATTIAAVLSTFGSSVRAEVVIDTVTVGNPGNAGELSGKGAGGFGPDRICGAVGYTYNIGMFEVTAGQYTEFLNAVAATDFYGLYNTFMSSGVAGPGCRIQRIGSPGTYTYVVDFDGDDVEDPDWVNRPVNFVSWGDAARFANWLHNGQPTGKLTGNPIQDLWLTEDGSYLLNGATSEEDLLVVTREDEASFVVPSEDEWYKAAYHYNDGVTENYFQFPTSSDSGPSNDLIDPDPGNNATYYSSQGGYTLGNPLRYFRTEVGAHEHSTGPYRTFDQGGNLFEWNEAILHGSVRATRGGSFGEGGLYCLHAANRSSDFSVQGESSTIGFRVAEVPVPGAADLDGDGDADLHDFALFQSAFQGNLFDFAIIQSRLTGPA